jgi:CheY-like chemotaxis protein
MLSHELRNPLAAIRNATAAISLEKQDTTRREAAIAVIARQAQHMSHLLDDLLDVSRLTQDRLKLQLSEVALDAAAHAAIEMMQPMAAAARVLIEFARAATDVWVRGDAVRLSQMVANLLSNAIKFSPAGSRVTMTLDRESDQAVIGVRDEGAGMTPAELAHVFDLFYQGTRAADPGLGGMGVGLTLARRIAELHGGTLEAASEGCDRGSLLTVRLPLLGARTAFDVRTGIHATISDRVSDVPVHAGDGNRPRRFVVVEDHQDNREMTAALLSMSGYEVRSAGDGHAGVALISEFKPDVALVDLGLPLLDGNGVARHVRARRDLDRVVLIAVSGYAQSSDIERSLAAGFDAHIAKPVAFDQLAALVQRACLERGDPSR